MNEERRQHPRIQIDRRAKIRNIRSGKLMPCLACDISRGGALVRFDQAVPVYVGDRYRIGIAGAESAGLLFSNNFVDVEVIRALRATDGRTAVAVRFLEPARVEEPVLCQAA